MKRALIKIWNWHGWIGKCLTVFCMVLFVSALVGIVLGTTKIKHANEVVYTNIFLNEQFDLHNSNYEVTVLSVSTKDEIIVQNKSGEDEPLSGHFVDAKLRIFQKIDSEEKPHVFDRDDFKLKGHTGVYLPLNDIAALVGWDMVDFHWDKQENGFVISSADISTQKAVDDYTYIGKTISPGKEVNFHVYLPISSKEFHVETSVMVLEIDFFWGGIWSERKRGEDVVLLPRPGNL